MYRVEIDVPGDGSSPFVSAKVAAEFICGITPRTLERLIRDHYPFVRQIKPGRLVHYDALDIGYLAQLIRRHGMPEGIDDEKS